jgi:hypothetical protein
MSKMPSKCIHISEAAVVSRDLEKRSRAILKLDQVICRRLDADKKYSTSSFDVYIGKPNFFFFPYQVLAYSCYDVSAIPVCCAIRIRISKKFNRTDSKFDQISPKHSLASTLALATCNSIQVLKTTTNSEAEAKNKSKQA